MGSTCRLTEREKFGEGWSQNDRERIVVISVAKERCRTAGWVKRR